MRKLRDLIGEDAEPDFKGGSKVGLAKNAPGVHFQCKTCEYIREGVCSNPDPELHGRRVQPDWCCNLYDHPGMVVISKK